MTSRSYNLPTGKTESSAGRPVRRRKICFFDFYKETLPIQSISNNSRFFVEISVGTMQSLIVTNYILSLHSLKFRGFIINQDLYNINFSNEFPIIVFFRFSQKYPEVERISDVSSSNNENDQPKKSRNNFWKVLIKDKIFSVHLGKVPGENLRFLIKYSECKTCPETIRHVTDKIKTIGLDEGRNQSFRG